ncbi:MAG TPA: HAMP domain-containing sensor histidine kinase [Blastocatellia bacterium]|nr:HAMP domain-containing sensor histidine kinase [Blastocatellia bacterium]
MMIDLLNQVVAYIYSHPHGVRAMVGAVSAICAAVTFLLQPKVKSARAWAWSFGLGFAIYAGGNLLQAVLGQVLTPALPVGQQSMSLRIDLLKGIDAAFVIGPCLTSLFFFAAARNLLNRKPVVPTLAWISAGFGLLALIPESRFVLCRVPEAAFSAYALGLLTHALSTNIRTRPDRREWWSGLAFTITIGFGLIQVSSMLHPVLAQSMLLPSLAFPNPLGLTNSASWLSALDTLATAATLPVYIGLFLLGIQVQSRLITILSSEAPDHPLASVTSQRQRVLTSESFLSVGQVVGADLLELAVRVPGNKEQKLLIIAREKNAPITAPRAVPFPSLNSPIIEKVLLTGSEVSWHDEYEHVDGVPGRRLTESERAGSAVAVPIVFQSAVIGCIRIWAPVARGFSTTAISQIRAFARVAALAAQGEREMDAAEQFSSTYTRWRVAQKVMAVNETEISDAIQAVTEFLLNVLSTVAVIIHLDAGFKSYIKIGGDSGEANLIRGDLDQGLTAAMEGLRHRATRPLEIVRADLLNVAKEIADVDRILVGELYLVVPEEATVYPTLGSSYLLRRTVATLVTAAVLDAVRDHFASLIKVFGVAMNDKGLASHAQWFDEVEKIAKGAGLSWVVATLEETEQHGQSEWREVVRGCLEGRRLLEEGSLLEERATREEQRLWEEKREKFGLIETLGFSETDVIRIHHPILGKHTVLSVGLSNTNARIWFGVGREGFGAELASPSTWTLFLERLSDIADSALLRLRVQRLQMESAEAWSLATYSMASDTVFHQIANMVRDIVNPISSISEALAIGTLSANDDAVELIKLSDQAAGKLLDFAFNFMNVNKLDAQRPCSLLKVIDQSKDLFEFTLKRNQIVLDVRIAEDLVIDIPFNVAFLAIANLISNARDAIGRRGGEIKIEAENAGEMIHCYVTNNGPCVDHRIRDRIFQMGVTTKKNGGGWGLYLAYRSLIENRGFIELMSSEPGETKFMIRFPLIRQEQL